MAPAPHINFSPASLTHVNIYVSDLERSKAFYADICGLTPVYNEPAINASFFSNGFTHHDIALMQCSDKPLIGKDGKVQNSMVRGRQPGLNHLAFVVPNEAQLIEAYKKAAKSCTRSGVVKCLDHGISHSVYLSDPDNNLVEFYADAVQDWRRSYAEGNDGLITSQWDPLGVSEPCEFAPPQTQDNVVGAPLQPRRVARATLLVSDLNDALDYYQRVGGLEVMLRDDTERFAILGGTQRRYDLALVEVRGDESTGLNCVGFDLVGPVELDRVAAGLTAKDVRVKTVSSRFKQSIAFKDDDGFQLEFYRTAPLIDAAFGPTRQDLVMKF